MSGPVVDVLLPIHNGASFLRQHLDSLVSQESVEVRLRVLDDQSMDQSLSIVEDYRTRMETIVVPNNAHRGLPAAFLMLIDAVPLDARYVAFAHQDDVWHPRKLAAATAALGAGAASLWMSSLAPVDSRGAPLRGATRRRLRIDTLNLSFARASVRTLMPGCAMVFDGALLARLRGLDPSRIVMHDAVAGLAAFTLGGVAADPRPLVAYRQHPGNTIGLPRGLRSVPRRLASFRKDPWRVQAAYLLDHWSAVLHAEQRHVLEVVSETRGHDLAARISLARDLDYRFTRLRDSVATTAALLGR